MNEERINNNGAKGAVADPKSSRTNDLIIDEGFPALNTFRRDTITKEQLNKEGNQIDDGVIPQFPFASFPSAVNINPEQRVNIIHDCELTFTARTKEDSDAYSSGATYFIPASMKPRCALEELALKIFQTHTKHLEVGKHYDLERSGAEWWTLVLDTSSSKDENGGEENEDDDEEEEDDEVGMHFDADYGLEEQLPNYMLHPRIATVTYLSNIGVPTFVMNKKSPPPNDVEKKSLNGSIDKGWISYPILGKHISFDGRLLHGAIGTFNSNKVSKKIDEETEEPSSKRRKIGDGGETKPTTQNGTKRITFMVNVWLNHCPIDAEIIEDDLCAKMKTYWEKKDEGKDLKSDAEYKEPLQWTIGDTSERTKLETRDLSVEKIASTKSITEIIDSVICNREVTINFRPSESTLNEIADKVQTCNGKSLLVKFAENDLELKVGKVVEDDDDDDEDE